MLGKSVGMSMEFRCYFLLIIVIAVKVVMGNWLVIVEVIMQFYKYIFANFIVCLNEKMYLCGCSLRILDYNRSDMSFLCLILSS